MVRKPLQCSQRHHQDELQHLRSVHDNIHGSIVRISNSMFMHKRNILLLATTGVGVHVCLTREPLLPSNYYKRLPITMTNIHSGERVYNHGNRGAEHSPKWCSPAELGFRTVIEASPVGTLCWQAVQTASVHMLVFWFFDFYRGHIGALGIDRNEAVEQHSQVLEWDILSVLHMSSLY